MDRITESLRYPSNGNLPVHFYSVRKGLFYPTLFSTFLAIHQGVRSRFPTD